MRYFGSVFLLLLLLVSGCAGLKQNQDPVADIEYYTTKELLEMHESLLVSLQTYKGMPDNMTNRKKLTSLEDETAGLNKRKILQIERELRRRNSAGDASARYDGMESSPPPAAGRTP